MYIKLDVGVVEACSTGKRNSILPAAESGPAPHLPMTLLKWLLNRHLFRTTFRCRVTKYLFISISNLTSTHLATPEDHSDGKELRLITDARSNRSPRYTSPHKYRRALQNTRDIKLRVSHTTVLKDHPLRTRKGSVTKLHLFANNVLLHG